MAEIAQNPELWVKAEHKAVVKKESGGEQMAGVLQEVREEAAPGKTSGRVWKEDACWRRGGRIEKREGVGWETTDTEKMGVVWRLWEELQNADGQLWRNTGSPLMREMIGSDKQLMERRWTQETGVARNEGTWSEMWVRIAKKQEETNVAVLTEWCGTKAGKFAWHCQQQNNDAGKNDAWNSTNERMDKYLDFVCKTCD